MVNTGIPWFRELYDEILEYKRHSLFWDVLTPWIEKAQAAIDDISRFKTPTHFGPHDDTQCFAMWNLYALSRVNDLLLMSYQAENDKEYSGPSISLSDYSDFFSQLGFTAVDSDRFCPFHHEIVRVHPSQNDEQPISVLDSLWPGLMFGDLMFSRSGVEVLAGSNHVVKDVAERSTLYFSHRRLHRTTNDLSRGWGSNSQWRTRFRRDYRQNRKWIYNEDGEKSLNTLEFKDEDRDGLTPQERIELCRNRCFVITSKPSDDLFPFDDRFEEVF